MSAASTVLITPVLELFSAEYELDHLRLKETNPPLIEELRELFKDMTKKKHMSLCTIVYDH